MDRLLRKWKQYRYRFVPWIALNLKDRSVRSVPKGATDKLASDADVLYTLTSLFTAFHHRTNRGHDMHDRDLLSSPEQVHRQNLDVMLEVAGFSVQRAPSVIQGGGTGVKVMQGRVPSGSVTSLYPGLIYENYQPILFQSVGNPFIFRCIDSLLIDGNDKGISRFLFRSCHGRDRVGPFAMCDQSWLTPCPVNPLAIGQYVNNHNTEHSANVAYQECDVPADFPLHLRQYLPNTFYGSSLENAYHHRLLRLVVLVATRDIECGEELFSSYFTVVH